MKTPHILIVEDDIYISGLIALYLDNHQFTYTITASGAEALEFLYHQTPDLVLLDLMLPEVSGWQVCESFRNESDVPIIMVTGNGESYDKLRAFTLGVDDYVVKPFDPKELMARIHAVLRRSNPALFKEIIRFPDFMLMVDDHRVVVHDREIGLAPKELDLLYLLAAHPNKVFTREQLLLQVWGIDYQGDFRTVDVHIKRLREKLGESAHWFISTIWGVGYKFEVHE